jgi:hypothetical protein
MREKPGKNYIFSLSRTFWNGALKSFAASSGLALYFCTAIKMEDFF